MPYNEHDPAQYLSGINQEKYINRFFEMNGLGSIDHNSYDPSKYPFDNHLITDFELKDKALFECTNPKETTFLDDSIMENKIDYFKRKDPAHLLMWFLVVSFAVFSDKIKQLINKLGVTLIVLNYYATKTNRTAFIRHLFKSKFYSVIKRLKGKKSPSSISAQYTITTIPQYAVISNPALNIPAYLHQHRDTVEKVPQDTEQAPNRRFPARERFPYEPRFT